MRAALKGLKESIQRVRSVASEMDLRVLRATAADERQRDETVRCAATVILSGFFESFIKECVRAYVVEVSRRRIPFSDLPAAMQICHFNYGGQLVGQKARNLDRVSWVDVDHLDLAWRLASPRRNSTYRLVWEAFASTHGNPTPDTLRDVLRDLGVSQVATRLDAVIKGGYQPKKLALQSFIAVRNECAHSGTALKIPTTSDLRDYCDLIELLGRAIVQVLEQRLGEPPFALDLNSASAKDLVRIPGLGPTRVRHLLAARAAIGRFSKVDDVQAIPGFSKRSVAKLKQYLRV